MKTRFVEGLVLVETKDYTTHDRAKYYRSGFAGFYPDVVNMLSVPERDAVNDVCSQFTFVLRKDNQTSIYNTTGTPRYVESTESQHRLQALTGGPWYVIGTYSIDPKTGETIPKMNERKGSKDE